MAEDQEQESERVLREDGRLRQKRLPLSEEDVLSRATALVVLKTGPVGVNVAQAVQKRLEHMIKAGQIHATEVKDNFIWLYPQMLASALSMDEASRKYLKVRGKYSTRMSFSIYSKTRIRQT